MVLEEELPPDTTEAVSLLLGAPTSVPADELKRSKKAGGTPAVPV
jgi:hypothetical protein